MSETTPVIALHGGAGTILKSNMTPEREAAYHAGLKACLEAGLKILNEGGSALDAATAAVMALEDNPLFNAGRGAVYTTDATHEMDAAVMDGATRACGAITGICCAIRCWQHAQSWNRLSMCFSPVTAQNVSAKMPAWK